MRTLTAILLLTLSVGFTACDKDDKTNSGSGNTTPTPTATEGSGRGVIYYGTDSIVTQGICGASNALGYYVITIKDAVNSAKTFNIGLNTTTLPSVTTTYSLVASQDENDEAILDFIQVEGSSITGWSSDDNSGTVTLVVEGNKVTCNFSSIPLNYYTMYNDPPYDVNATAKATMTFYK